MRQIKTRTASGTVIAVVLLGSFVITALGAEQDNDGKSLATGTFAKAIEKNPPTYPRIAQRRGQEGWVIVSYVIQPDGRVTDPIIEDSSGIDSFEQETLRVVQTWRYEPATWNGEAVEQYHTKHKLTFAIEVPQGKRGAKKKFRDKYRDINALIQNGEIETAESMIDEAFESPGWNMYETTRLWLLSAQVQIEKGDDKETLTSLRRAAGGAEFIEPEIYADILQELFALEFTLDLFSDALNTYAKMQQADALEGRDDIIEAAERLQKFVSGTEPLVMNGLVEPHGSVEEGIWSYRPLRRKLAFDNIDGHVDSIEFRCDWHRAKDKVSTDRTWEIPESWGNCNLYVYGDPGARFHLIEYAAVASN